MPTPIIPILGAVAAAVAAATTGVVVERYLRKRDERGDAPIRLTGIARPPLLSGVTATPLLKLKGITAAPLPEPEPEPPPEAPKEPPKIEGPKTPYGLPWPGGVLPAGTYWKDESTGQQFMYAKGFIAGDDEKLFPTDWVPVNRGGLCSRPMEGARSASGKSVCAPTPMRAFGAGNPKGNTRWRWMKTRTKAGAALLCTLDPFFHGDICYQRHKGLTR